MFYTGINRDNHNQICLYHWEQWKVTAPQMNMGTLKKYKKKNTECECNPPKNNKNETKKHTVPPHLYYK